MIYGSWVMKKQKRITEIITSKNTSIDIENGDTEKFINSDIADAVSDKTQPSFDVFKEKLGSDLVLCLYDADANHELNIDFRGKELAGIKMQEVMAYILKLISMCLGKNKIKAGYESKKRVNDSLRWVDPKSIRWRVIQNKHFDRGRHGVEIRFIHIK